MKRSSTILMILLAAGFVAGLVHLFQLRFAAGDVYPPYSSLRADPLGTRALFDSLDPLLPVTRNFDPLTRLADERNATLFFLGADAVDLRLATNEYRSLETFVRAGGRLVVAFSPRYAAQRPNQFATPRRKPGASPNPTNQPPPSPQPPAGNDPDPFADPNTKRLGDLLAVRTAYAPLGRDNKGTYPPTTAERRSDTPLPEHLSIHTALYFETPGPGWTVHYSRHRETNDEPVIIERSLGRGTIVLAADAFPFSNEALRADRQSQLLTWFAGSSKKIVFDETHLGTRNDPGVAAMARRYRLQGLAAALVLLALLFIWRNSISFLPPDAEVLAAEGAHQVIGKDSTEGFINLLRRNVAPADVLKLCLEQWNTQAVGSRKPPRWKLEAMQKLIDEQNALELRQRNPVRTYQQFCAILHQQK